MEKVSTESREIKLFGEWSFQNLQVDDIGLQKYITLEPVFIPHSMGRHEHHRFYKAKVNIVERFINNLMRPGENAGKKTRAISTLRNAFEIISLQTGNNPIAVLLRAIENSAPCEDTTRISYGGVAYHMATDISPQRRVDIALRLLSEGSRRSTFGNSRTLEECTAEELILASNSDVRSHAVSKRNEMERIARANR
ncbi:MAG: 30S ribosomal protein S7 [Candidatus Bathyarchaeota archaeon]|nr:MAG: 30S ribosomal protein S7 [Candidatus Bathyarchaeota archaeon]